MITGATGFAGSSLVLAYNARGWTVHGTFRDESESDLPTLPDTHFHCIDLLDAAAVRALIRATRAEVVHHLAAQSSVSVSLGDPMGTLSENATAQFNVLEALLESQKTSRVLVVGSCDEYGNVPPELNPVAEDVPLRPMNPYALSKVVQDLMGRQYFESHGLCVVRVRPFLQLGPRRSDRFVAGSFARQIAEIERGMQEPVIDVGNIDLIRDFTDVRDMADGFMLAVEEGEPGEVYNLASGAGHSLRDMLDVMLRLSGLTVDIRERGDLQRYREAPVLIGNFERMRSKTGWMPRIPFEQSAEDTLTYWRERVRGRV